MISRARLSWDEDLSRLGRKNKPPFRKYEPWDLIVPIGLAATRVSVDFMYRRLNVQPPRESGGGCNDRTMRFRRRKADENGVTKFYKGDFVSTDGRLVASYENDTAAGPEPEKDPNGNDVVFIGDEMSQEGRS